MQDLADFLEPVSPDFISNDEGFTDGQIGHHIELFKEDLPDLTDINIVFIGVDETRGSGYRFKDISASNNIRRQLYRLHYWHKDIRMADLGNIKTGAGIKDSYAAIKTVISELLELNKTVIILGGSHDITLAQYESYRPQNKNIEVTCIDAMIDLHSDSSLRSDNFLMELLTGEPNMVRHYNHIGFQSYFVHPRMLETMDKLRFDCYRVGKVSEDTEEMEPVLRNSNMLSIDISAIKYSDAPANIKCPNGLSGIDACTLTRYAGMSHELSSLGIYGYKPEDDVQDLTAKQISQMIWYFIDGKSRSLQEASLADRHHFNEYHTAFAEVDTTFLQSKKTSRWWMQMPDQKFIPCSYSDYVKASQNEIPERWLRIQERN